MKRLFLILSFLVSIACWVNIGFAQKQEIDLELIHRETLRDLDGVSVVVRVDNIFSGVYAAQLEQEAELVLRQSGIKVLDGWENRPEGAEIGLLKIDVNATLWPELEAYAICVLTRLEQPVLLARNAEIVSLNGTW